ncbi:hypothetical protein M9Y10_024410 [Tritrichomonas musculus]|uniref:Transmembrane protein n=1 Tax=Tritrichomonas musculus TaxID=1915356 RepID=A0ABR2HCV4_9EUKA
MTERQHKTKRSIYLYTCQQTNPICQQELRGCRQTFDRHPTFCFIIFMIFHILIGIISIGFTNDIREYKIRYDDKCGLSETNPTGTADIYFNNPPLSGNIFFYFELHDYYQTYFLMAPNNTNLDNFVQSKAVKLNILQSLIFSFYYHIVFIIKTYMFNFL